MLWTDLTFGVEIECFIPGGEAAATRAIVAAGVSCISTSGHSTIQQWKVVPDGSLRNVGPGGCEAVSPILRGEEGLQQVRTVVAALRAAGAVVNTHTGLHVHIGARQATVAQLRNLCKLFLKYEGQFDALVPASRRSNRYCQSNASVAAMRGGDAANLSRSLDGAGSVAALARVMNGGWEERQHYTSFRYYKLNLQSYASHGTVEFRQHSGTLDPAKIDAWVRLVAGFCARAFTLTSVRWDGQPGTFSQLVAKADRETAQFLTRRRAALQRDPAEIDAPLAGGRQTPAPTARPVADEADIPF